MALSVLAQMLKSRWKTTDACMAALFPEADETERREIVRNLNFDEINRHNRGLFRGARDQEPGEPPDAGVMANGRFGEPGGFGPQSGSTNIEEDQMDPELEELLDALAERLPGAEDRLIRFHHDRRRRRAVSDRRSMGRDRRWSEDFSRHEADADQGSNTHAEPLPRLPPVTIVAGARTMPGRGATAFSIDFRNCAESVTASDGARGGGATIVTGAGSADRGVCQARRRRCADRETARGAGRRGPRSVGAVRPRERERGSARRSQAHRAASHCCGDLGRATPGGPNTEQALEALAAVKRLVGAALGRKTAIEEEIRKQEAASQTLRLRVRDAQAAVIASEPEALERLWAWGMRLRGGLQDWQATCELIGLMRLPSEHRWQNWHAVNLPGTMPSSPLVDQWAAALAALDGADLEHPLPLAPER